MPYQSLKEEAKQVTKNNVIRFCPILQDGEIYTKQGLDRERRSQFVFTVMLEEKRTTSKIVRFLFHLLSTFLP